MIIRNKFNGYGFDGSRLCHDPVSLSIAATQAGAASAAAAGTAAAGTAATTAAATAAAQAAAQAAAVKAAAAEAAKAAALEGGKAASLEAGKTAALETAKQQAIQQGTQQAAQQAAQQGITQAGTQAAQQTGVEAAKQGIFSANPAGMPPTAGAPITPAGGTPFTPPTAGATPMPPAGGTPPMSFEQQLAAAKENAAKELAARGGNVKGAATQPFNNVSYTTPVDPTPMGADAVKAAQSASQKVADVGTSFYDKPIIPEGIGIKPPAPSTNPLLEGAKAGLEFAKAKPLETGLLTMGIGQYMNQPDYEDEDKDKYKNTVDMSKFQASTPTQQPFTRSYEYQSYAMGGPVEQMANINSIGANTGYPMANLQTPMYSNPGMQRPEATNIIAPSADAGVNTYTGEPRFAEGGLSSAERREYGLRTRKQRAAQSLTKSYEEMEEERQREAMKLFGESSLPTPRPIARSRTQELSSPFSAALAEHARLGKKTKVPVVQMPKTNLGDVDNYMDIPIEAAKGGIMHGLGGYSDGGRLLKGPGDGVSDSIPAVIGKRQPARLADGEFVIPARIVSELGNGSTEAGARKLYAMMERVQASRKKSIGKKKVAVNSKSDKHLPA